jgi:hypothetical protein
MSLVCSNQFNRHSGIIKAMGASTFGSTEDSQPNIKSQSATHLSAADEASHNEKKKFGIRRAHSGASK